jgi:hypothetical protein
MHLSLKVFFSAFLLTVLAAEGVRAEIITVQGTGTDAVSPEIAATPAYKEWARKHAEWQRNYDQWEKGYKKWLEEQSRLDDGLMIAIGAGLSPTRVNTVLSGGNNIDFPDAPPYPEINLRGLGGTLDVRLGWLVNNDPYLKDYFFGKDELHDQLYLSLDFIGRLTPYTQLRFNQSDSDNVGGFAHAAYSLDLIGGIGTTYIIYPYLVSFSTTVGLGIVAIQKIASTDDTYDGKNIRTDIGPAVNMRVGQEWRVSENWKSGFALSYGYMQAINRPRTEDRNNTYQEFYHSHLFSIQWLNTFTPPKYRRGAPPKKPQQWQPYKAPSTPATPPQTPAK